MLHKLARNLQFKQILASFGLAIFSLLVIFFYLLWEEKHDRGSAFTEFKETIILKHKQKIAQEINFVVKTISLESNENREALKYRVKSEVLKAHIIATKLFHELQTSLPEKKIKHTIVETLRNIRFFDGRGYIFIDDLQGNNILMPPNPEIEGTSLSEKQDDSIKNVVKDMLTTVMSKKQEGFVNYRWAIPQSDKTSLDNKLSFVKRFTPYNWLIGSGEYITYAEKDIKQNLLKRISSKINDEVYFISIKNGSGKSLIPHENTSGNKLTTSFSLRDKNHLQQPIDFIATHSIKEPIWKWEISGGYYPEKLDEYVNELWLAHTIKQNENFNNLILGLLAVSAFILLSALLMSIWITKTFRAYREEQEHQRNTLLQNQTELELDARVFNSTNEGIIITDKDNKIIKCNSAFTAITGYEETEVKGKNPSFLNSQKTPKYTYKSMWDSLMEKGHWQGEVINRHKTGFLFPEWLSINVHKDKSGDVISYIGTITDITSRKRIQEKLEHLAHFDSLTDLPNRRQLNDFIEHSIIDEETSCFYILFMDLDNFKFINDSLGHAVGDKVLQKTATRLANLTGSTNLACRLGGDEFVAVIKDSLFIPDIKSFVESLKNKIGEPINIQQNTLVVTPSIGISQYPKDGESNDILLKNADIALYLAKDNGRNRYEFFTSSLSKMAAERVSLEQDLRHAIRNNQFELFYQPQIDLNTKNLTGCEALIRWNHPKRGKVPPDVFIPIAEETGLIIEIGHWVIEEAFRQLSYWEIKNGDFNMAINFSARQFDVNAPKTIQTLIKKYQLDAKSITLEITESLLIKQPEQAIQMLTEIRNLGIKIALDDFGTGFSSLSYLKKFPLDKLKIDRSFIKEMHHNKDDIAITKSIVATAQHFDLITIAEGVENEEQETLLQKIGCHHVQGYYYSKPVTAFNMQQKIKQNISGKHQLVFGN